MMLVGPAANLCGLAYPLVRTGDHPIEEDARSITRTDEVLNTFHVRYIQAWLSTYLAKYTGSAYCFTSSLNYCSSLQPTSLRPPASIGLAGSQGPITTFLYLCKLINHHAQPPVTNIVTVPPTKTPTTPLPTTCAHQLKQNPQSPYVCV